MGKLGKDPQSFEHLNTGDHSELGRFQVYKFNYTHKGIKENKLKATQNFTGWATGVTAKI